MGRDYYSKHYLILGATGTLGRAMTSKLLTLEDTGDIVCLSRDELKQAEFKKDFPDHRVKTVIGDIRDKQSINEHFRGIDVVFHFAALKRIPEMERHPLESLKTNVLGTINAAECAIDNSVTHFVFSSTDKACRPINTYGASKFLSEQILLNNYTKAPTRFSVYRWGNVLASRGSVIYAFKDCIENDRPAHITNKDMSRFWIKIEDAVQFILDSYMLRTNKINVPQMKAATVVQVLDSIARVSGKKAAYEISGMRAGEKIHEDILFNAENGNCLSSNNAEQFHHSDLDAMMKVIL